MDLPDGITTWQQFRSEYAKLNPKSAISNVSEAWSRYKEEGRVGDVSVKPSTKRTPKKASVKKPSPKHMKKPSPKKQTSPKVVREQSTELIPVSATLTGLPTELGMKISGYVGKETARSMQIASKRTQEFSSAELKQLCETEPTAQEYSDVIVRRKEPTSFYTRDETALLSRLSESPQHYNSRYSIIREGKNINIQRTSISTWSGNFKFSSELVTTVKRQYVLVKLTLKDIPRLVNDLEAKEAHVYHRIVARTHPTVYDLGTVREVYKRRLSCLERADNYIKERLRAYIVRSYESILNKTSYEGGIDSKAVLSGNYESIQTSISPQPYNKVINYLARLITLIITLKDGNPADIITIIRKRTSNDAHEYLLDRLRSIYDSV